MVADALIIEQSEEQASTLIHIYTEEESSKLSFSRMKIGKYIVAPTSSICVINLNIACTCYSIYKTSLLQGDSATFFISFIYLPGIFL